MTGLLNRFLFVQPNHLVGLRRNYIKLSFMNVTDLMKVKRYVESSSFIKTRHYFNTKSVYSMSTLYHISK